MGGTNCHPGPVREGYLRVVEIKCPKCDVGSNEQGVYLGFGRIRCLACKTTYKVQENGLCVIESEQKLDHPVRFNRGYRSHETE